MCGQATKLNDHAPLTVEGGLPVQRGNKLLDDQFGLVVSKVGDQGGNRAFDILA